MSGYKQRIAFIGTGIMGAPIAGHLLHAGYGLTVYNRTAEKSDALVAAGAHRAESIAEAVRDADVVFTMVGYPTDVEEVYLTSEGILNHAKKGAWLIDLTTSSPQLAQDLYAAAEIQDMHAFDCPVTGGQAGAEAGTLTLIAGISEQDAAPVADILKCFSSKICYFGKAGAGQSAKLCNQVSLASCMIGMCDAFALAEQSGIDPRQLVDLLQSGTGGSRAIETLSDKIFASDFRPGFLAEHMRKDIALALTRSEELDITLPGATTAFTLLDMLCQIGGSRLGSQAMALLYAEEETTKKAGLDWTLLDRSDEYADDEHECSCHHGDEGHECGCHGHGDDHECCGGHGHGEVHGGCGCHHHE